VIPRILHQVWLGPKRLPDEFADYRETWRRHHPSWQLRLWTEDNLPADLRRPEVYERLRVPAERSDILRLEVLYRDGGVYVDTDFECRGPLDDLIEGLDFFAAYLKPGRANNAVIGAVPGHPILDRALDEVRPVDSYGYDKHAAGPLFLDALLKDYPDVTIFDPPVFYPATPAEREQAVAIHHAARSWKDAEGFRQAALRAEARLARAQKELEAERKRHEKTRRALEIARGGRANGVLRLPSLLRRPRAGGARRG
jgi:mannosyltransferase OCH1-like enzyme